MMRLSTFLRTARHLRPRQAAALLAHRLRRRGDAELAPLPAGAQKSAGQAPHLPLLSFPNEDALDARTGTAHFLNIAHNFEDGVNWNCAAHGALWQYHLGYFRWLENATDPALALEGLSAFADAYSRLGAVLDPYPSSLRVVYGSLFCIRHGIRDARVLAILYTDALRLARRPEYHLLGNHLLENGLALTAAAALFGTPLFRKKAEAILCEQLPEQILPDGCHVERSPGYHCAILGRVMHVLQLAEAGNALHASVISGLLRKAAEVMLGWITAYTGPQYPVAHFGDSVADEAPSLDALRDAARRLNIATAPVELRESGYRVIAGAGWRATVNLSGPAPPYQPGHSHADALAFCLFYDGALMVGDAGVSTYASGARRTLERSTVGHSTASFADRDSSEMWASFRIGRRARVRIVESACDHLTAEHDGYRTWNRIHRRTFRPMPDSFSIVDSFLRSNHSPDRRPPRWTTRIWFAPGLHPVQDQKTGDWLCGEVRIVLDGFASTILKPAETGVGFNCRKPVVVLEAIPAKWSTRITFHFPPANPPGF